MEGRDEFLAEVRARLVRFRDTGDLALVREPAAVAAVGRFAEIQAEHGDDGETAQLPRRLHWHRSRAPFEDESHVQLEASIRSFLSMFIGGGAELPQPLLEVFARRALPAVFDVFKKVVKSADLALVSSAVGLIERITHALPGDDRVCGLAVQTGLRLQARFGLTGSPTDLEVAIMTGQAVVVASTEAFPRRPSLWAAYLHVGPWP